MDTERHDVDALIAELGLGRHLLDTDTVAKAAKLSPRTVEDHRVRGIGAPYIRISRSTVRYRPRAVARWILERERRSTAEEPELAERLATDDRPLCEAPTKDGGTCTRPATRSDGKCFIHSSTEAPDAETAGAAEPARATA